MLQGWGALVQGQVQRRSAKHAVAALQRFCELGGSPDNRMVDMVVGLCLGQRDRYHAVQVRPVQAGQLLPTLSGCLGCLPSGCHCPAP